MNKLFALFALLLSCISLFAARPVAAAPNNYIGDSAIYAAVDTGVERPRPNVLLIIDNSQATLNRASGTPYDPAVEYPNRGFSPWYIYAGDNQGQFSRVEVVNSTSALAGLTCDKAVVRNSLTQNGTYSGSGFVDYPNLSGGACSTGPKGATYALGNYLNYLNDVQQQAGAVVVKNVYDCNVTYKIGKKVYVEPVTNGCVASYELTASNVASSTNKPGSGSEWQNFWTFKQDACLPAASDRCGSTSVPSSANATSVSSLSAWAEGDSYTLSAAFTGDTQRAIVYNALDTVIDGTRWAVNFGAMTFGGNNQGGKVVYDMSDLRSDAAFSAFMAAIPGPLATQGEPVLSSQTGRPQAESLYDAGHYLGAAYPTASGTESPNQYVTEPKTVPISIKNPCGYNHIILITNGLSNGDGGSASTLQLIGDYDGDEWPNEAVYGAGSHYLDDVAAYLNDKTGIRVHTVLAFQASDPLVSAAAYNGEGKYYNVYDANSLAAALTKLLTSIVLDADTSFVAPVVPASSTNRTISSNRVYLGLFKPQNNRPWLGNLKKYGVSSSLVLLDRSGNPATDANGDFLPESKSYWGANASDKIISIDGPLPLSTGGVSGDGGNVGAGGAGGTLIANMQAGVTRNVYTYPSGSASTLLTHSDNSFTTGNANITATALGVSTTDRDKLIAYICGLDGYDDDKDNNTTEVRNWIMGDILHSKPLVFNYSSFTEAQEGSCDHNKSMIFVGANDGMLHAFKDCDGSEAWAFIPDNVLGHLKYLRESDHNYFVDGSSTAYVHDVDNDNVIETADGDKVVLLFGQRRGGGRNTLDASGSRGAYYAIDVSNPLAPNLLWKIDNTVANFGEMGEPWSQPRLAKMKIGTDVKVVAFIGGGYDSNEDLRFGNNTNFPDDTDATTDTTLPRPNGGTLSSSGSSAPFNPKGRGIFAINVATLTPNASGKYIPDFTNSGTHLWSYTYNATTHAAMVYSFPSDLTVLDLNNDGFFDRIYVGDTGGRMWRFNVGDTDTGNWTGTMIFTANEPAESNKGRKIFYKPAVAIVDDIPVLYFGTGDRSHPLNTSVVDRMFAVKDRGQSTAVDIDNLVNLTENRLQVADPNEGEIDGILASLNAADKYGWYINLNESTHAGEKVLAAPLVFNRQVFFTTYTPQDPSALSLCQIGNLGKSRVYQLDFATAEAVRNYYGDNDDEGTDANERAKGGDNIVLRKEDRIKEIGVGIPSGIVTLIDASGRVTLMISSSNRVGTYQAPDSKLISPLYWVQL